VNGQPQARRARAGGLILAALAVVLLAAGFGIGGQLGSNATHTGPPRPIAAAPSEAPISVPVVPRPTPPTPVLPEDRATPEPTPTPTPKPDIAKGPTHRVATRVVVPELGIDLPVARQKSSYPSCDIAMYLTRFEQPGQGGPVYLYAHARRGMFLELLEQSQRRNGAAMLGMEIHVYTGDNLKFRYEITRVRRHARDFGPVYAARGETIWLQTSEGPNASYPKLQVAGELVGRKKVSHDEAHPKPHPRSC
jgi:hypothetical protein